MRYSSIFLVLTPLFLVADLEETPFLEASSPVETPDQGKVSSPSMPLPPFSMPGQYDGSIRVGFAADYLYLKTQEEELSYGTSALTATTQALTNPLNVLNGQVLRMNPGFHSGVRVAGSFWIPSTDWDVRATWTGYKNQTKASTSTYLWPFLLNPTEDPPFAGSAVANWNLSLNQLDGEFAVHCFSNQFFSFVPRIGVRAAWISQNLDATYLNVDFTGVNLTHVVYGFVESRNSSTMSGAGLLGGVDINWVFGKGFSFYTNGTAALLWSTFDLLQKETVPSGGYRSSLRDKVRDLSPVIDLALGAQWETTFSQNRGLFQCRLGWEEHMWFHQNQFDRFVDTQVMGSVVNDNGNLGLSGFTLSLKIGF